MRQVKKEDDENGKEDESNSSKESNDLQAKCEDPEGTTYRLRDRREAKEAKRKAQVEIQARNIAAPTPSEGDDITGDEADERDDAEPVIAESFADSQRQFIRNPKGPASARTTSDLLVVRSPVSPASDRSSREHDSDPSRPEAPRGHVRRRRRRGMLKGPDAAQITWGGPQEGDDKDEAFLVDYAENFAPGSPRTGQARTTDSGNEWSPRTAPKRPTTLRPLVVKALRDREKRRQVIERTGRLQDLDRPVIDADVQDEEAEPIPSCRVDTPTKTGIAKSSSDAQKDTQG